MPRKIFLFGLCVIALIFIVSEAIPEGMNIGGLVFRSPDYRKLLKKTETERYRDISEIIGFVDTLEIQIIHEVDTITDNDSIRLVLELELERMRAENPFHAFEFPDGQDTLLFPFFRLINNTQSRNAPIRVLHYGDSQIEADRITSAIRNYFQRNHGGRGIGFLPIVPIADVAITFQRNVSSGWRRFSILERGAERLETNNFGISGNFVRYFPANENDTVARIGILPYYDGYRNAQTFTDVRLFYGQSQFPLTAIVNRADTLTYSTRNTVSSARWRFEAPQNTFDLLLASSDMPDIYGIALDGERGVAVDNLPLRGSSGLDFSRIDTEQMRQMLRIMDVEMLILQFGANVLTAHSGNYDYYSRMFARQLQFLKSLKPGLAIIVVGVGDISQNTPDGYVSHPDVVRIRDVQKRAAFETGCVFWDLYEAMGGENSMPSWVFAQPPLAQRDFMHFTISGARIAGDLFCRALAAEYQKFTILAR